MLRGMSPPTPGMEAPAPDIDQLAEQLAAAMPKLEPTEQEIAVNLLRLLADGQPVSTSRLAATLGLPEAQLGGTLAGWPGVFYDDEERVIGVWGLTVREMGSHRLEVAGRELWAWCAWDTLFLPELLGQTARVTSKCPTTGQDIALTVGPGGISELRPVDAMVSFLLPQTPFDANIIQSFCHFVHFFASAQAGQAWTAQHPETFLIPVNDAHKLGRVTNRATFGTAVGATA